MLEVDYRQELIDRLAEMKCRVQVPRALRRLFESRGLIESKPHERRRFTRLASPSKMLLEIEATIKESDGVSRFFSVLATDLSRSGVAFLHEQELFPGDAPVLWFPTGKVACRVARCLRHNARCFEIGTEFEVGLQSAAWVRSAGKEVFCGQKASE